MPAVSGRSMTLAQGATVIAGIRSNNFTINNEMIDITDQGDAGWRTLLADAGVRNVSLTGDGVTIDGAFIARAVGAASGLLTAYTLNVVGIGSFTGNFFLTSVQMTGEMADAVTFSLSLESSGVIAYTSQ